MPEQTTRNAIPGEGVPLLCSRTFPATLDQASQARRFLTAILNGSPLTADAVTCLGELVGNSLIHSDSRLPGGTFTVRVEQWPGRLRVEVCDDGGPWTPGPRGDDDDGPASGPGPRPAPVPGLCGRGLLIVAALADRWDIAPRATAARRVACFELDMP